MAARALTPRMMRPEKRPQRSGADTLTGSLSWIVTGTGDMSGRFSAAPVSADTSRATPWIDRQSALFGVSLMTKTWSSRFRCSRMFWPTTASSGSTIRPPWSSDSFSSRAEHSMP
ncbi:hypothetical protein D9M72_504760 [compost metagenome]